MSESTKDLSVLIKKGLSYKAEIFPMPENSLYAIEILEIYETDQRNPNANFEILRLSQDQVTLSIVMIQAFLEYIEQNPSTIKELLLFYHNGYFIARNKGVFFPCSVKSLIRF